MRYERNIIIIINNNNSVVDYLIMSPELLPFVSKFEVADFNIMLSDVHNPVLFSLCNSNSLSITAGAYSDINGYCEKDQNEITPQLKCFGNL